MAFGKKKKKQEKKQEKKVQPIKSKKVPMSENPLYPPKKESAMKEIAISLGTLVGCLLLSSIIVMNFSYAAKGYPDDSSDLQQVVDQEQGDTTETSEESEENGNGIGKVTEDTEVEEVENQEIVEKEKVEEKNPDYIIPDSDTRVISRSELKGLSKEELSRARNEIYARHGRRFKDKELQKYFESKDWYEGTISPDAFKESMLSKTEIKNAETILSYEKSKGYK